MSAVCEITANGAAGAGLGAKVLRTRCGTSIRGSYFSRSGRRQNARPADTEFYGKPLGVNPPINLWSVAGGFVEECPRRHGCSNNALCPQRGFWKRPQSVFLYPYSGIARWSERRDCSCRRFVVGLKSLIGTARASEEVNDPPYSVP